MFASSACAAVRVEPTITSTPIPSITPSPSATVSPTITHSPSPTITKTPPPTPTPIGQSGLLVYEPYEEILEEIKAGFYKPTGEYVSHGIFLYSLRNLEMVALFPSGYHLEGTSPYMDRLLISEGKNLYYCSPTGQDLFLITDNFAHQDRGYSGGKSAYWSQDLDRIFFLGYTNNLKRIFSIKPDGTDLKPITEATSSYILIDTVVNGDLYWEQESPRYSERQTNLESSKTNIIYWSFFHDTEFSDDGKLILDWQRNLPIFTDIQTLETWKDPMIFGIRELTEGGHFSIGYSNEYINRRDAEITLSELILVGDEFQSAHIGTAWWNPDNERFMACVSMCVAPSAWCECNHYYLLDIKVVSRTLCKWM